MVILNANVYTVNDNSPNVTAIAIDSGYIVKLGDEADVASLIGNDTKVVDLEGKTVTPGWIEGHGHFLGMGRSMQDIDLLAISSYEELVDKVSEAVAHANPGEWIIGRGWHQSKWDSISGRIYKGFQSHDLLSEASPDNPVYLVHASGHAGFANAKAMEVSGVGVLSVESLSNKNLPGGEIVKDEDGNPTGIFIENATNLIQSHIPTSELQKDIKAMELAIDNCLRNGITSFHDAGVNEYQIELANQLLSEGNLKVRMYMMLSNTDTVLLQKWFEKGTAIGLGNNFITIRSIKIHADGALGSRGAWLLESYFDRSDHFGHETTPMKVVESIANRAIQTGFQVCTHAIGDRTNREVLDRYEETFKKYPEAAKNARFRIEHAQHLHPDDIPRFGKLNVIPAMQAIHMSSDRPWAIDRLGEKRIVEGAYVWQKLIQSGAIIVNGSDVPVEPINPLASFYASITRKTLDGIPDGGYESDQKMTRLQALKSYTINAAYAAFEENIKGSIEVGKLADLTVFDKNIMEIPEEQLLSTQVDMTIVDGNIVYQRK